MAHTNHHHHIDPANFYCNHWMATREGVTRNLVIVFTLGQVTKTIDNNREITILLEGVMTFIYCLILVCVRWRF